MKSYRLSLAGTILLGALAPLVAGCGDDSGPGQKIDAPPDMSSGPPDMSKMPGYDASSKGMIPPPGKTP